MKRFVIAITGGTVVLLGIAMIALPGPAVVVHSSGTGNFGDRVPLGAACFAGI